MQSNSQKSIMNTFDEILKWSVLLVYVNSRLCQTFPLAHWQSGSIYDLMSVPAYGTSYSQGTMANVPNRLLQPETTTRSFYDVMNSLDTASSKSPVSDWGKWNAPLYSNGQNAGLSMSGAHRLPKHNELIGISTPSEPIQQELATREPAQVRPQTNSFHGVMPDPFGQVIHQEALSRNLQEFLPQRQEMGVLNVMQEIQPHTAKRYPTEPTQILTQTMPDPFRQFMQQEAPSRNLLQEFIPPVRETRLQNVMQETQPHNMQQNPNAHISFQELPIRPLESYVRPIKSTIRPNLLSHNQQMLNGMLPETLNYAHPNAQNVIDPSAKIQMQTDTQNQMVQQPMWNNVGFNIPSEQNVRPIKSRTNHFLSEITQRNRHVEPIFNPMHLNSLNRPAEQNRYYPPMTKNINQHPKPPNMYPTTTRQNFFLHSSNPYVNAYATNVESGINTRKTQGIHTRRTQSDPGQITQNAESPHRDVHQSNFEVPHRHKSHLYRTRQFPESAQRSIQTNNKFTQQHHQGPYRKNGTGSNSVKITGNRRSDISYRHSSMNHSNAKSNSPIVPNIIIINYPNTLSNTNKNRAQPPTPSDQILSTAKPKTARFSDLYNAFKSQAFLQWLKTRNSGGKKNAAPRVSYGFITQPETFSNNTQSHLNPSRNYKIKSPTHKSQNPDRVTHNQGSGLSKFKNVAPDPLTIENPSAVSFASTLSTRELGRNRLMGPGPWSDRAVTYIPFTPGQGLLNAAEKLLQNLNSTRLKSNSHRQNANLAPNLNNISIKTTAILKTTTPSVLQSSSEAFLMKNYQFICDQLNLNKTPTSSLTFGPIKNDCGRYVKCVVTGATVIAKQEECRFGLWFDIGLGTCIDTDAISKPCKYNPCKNHTTQQVNVAHQSDCEAYYTCEGGSVTAEKCDPGSKFDSTTGMCCVPPKVCYCPGDPMATTETPASPLAYMMAGSPLDPYYDFFGAMNLGSHAPIQDPTYQQGTTNPYPYQDIYPHTPTQYGQRGGNPSLQPATYQNTQGTTNLYPKPATGQFRSDFTNFQNMFDPFYYNGVCVVQTCFPPSVWDHILCKCVPR